MIDEIIEKLRKENPGVRFEVNNNNSKIFSDYIEVRGSSIDELNTPSDMKREREEIYYGEFRYHMVPLP